MSTQSIALAFAGSADTDVENVKALLNDFVGLGDDDADGFPEPSEREITLILPITKKHLSDGLEAVLEWSEYADIPFIAVTDGEKSRAVDKILKDAEEVVRTANVTAGIVDLLKNADSQGDAHVILLWGDEGSEEAELLLDAAEQAGIKAKDLTAGLDDISFAEPEAAPEPVLVKEPEPEPEEPRRGRRRGRRAEPEEAQPEEQPLTEDEPETAPTPEPEPEKPSRRRGRKPQPVEDPVEEDIQAQQADEKESLQETIARAQHKAQQSEAAKPVPDAEIDLLLIRSALEGAYKVFRLEDERIAVMMSLADVHERPLTELLRKALHTLPQTGEQKEKAPEAAEQSEGEQEESSSRRRRGRPRDESKTFAFLVDDEGNYTRRGRGRIPTGSKVVHLTRAEIEEKGLELDSE